MHQPFRTLSEAADALRAGTVSSRELVDAALADADALDPLLGVYLTRFADEAILAAKAADAEAAGDRGRIHGLPIAVKDNLATAEAATTAQSQVYDPDWWRGRDAPAVARLRAGGAVILGKTTMAEYAMGRPDPAHPFPVPRNPWDPDRWTGGSSTGNGAGLAAGLFLGALGTDTSGSIRLPAALCGATGLMPTRGLVPADGCLPLSPSQDVVGPMAVSVRDCALLLGTLTGHEHPVGTVKKNLRIGVPYDLLQGPGITGDCHAAFTAALRTLEEQGAEVREFKLPEFGTLLAVNAVVMLAEAFAVHGARLAGDWDGHGRSFRRLAATGATLPAHLYLQAKQAQARTTAELLARMDGPGGVDVIATPTWPAAARPYSHEAAPGDELNLTAPWNAAGFPALALPMGADPAGLPLSLQLVARPHAEHLLIAVGDTYQQRTDWHLRRADPDRTGLRPPPPDPDAAPARTENTADAEAALAAVGITPGPADLAAVARFAHAVRQAGNHLPR